MTKRTLSLIAIIITLTLIPTGGLIGQSYARAVARVACNTNPNPRTPADWPEWKDLEVVYLGPTGSAVQYPEFDPTKFTTQLNAKIVSSAADVEKHSQQYGLDVLIVDSGYLTILDRDWAKRQYSYGTTFVGLNIATRELGTLVDDAGLAGSGGQQPATPFFSMGATHYCGDLLQITALRTTGRLTPQNYRSWIKWGFDDVYGGWLAGYMSAADLFGQLDTIRINLDKQKLVRP